MSFAGHHVEKRNEGVYERALTGCCNIDSYAIPMRVDFDTIVVFETRCGMLTSPCMCFVLIRNVFEFMFSVVPIKHSVGIKMRSPYVYA